MPYKSIKEAKRKESSQKKKQGIGGTGFIKTNGKKLTYFSPLQFPELYLHLVDSWMQTHPFKDPTVMEEEKSDDARGFISELDPKRLEKRKGYESEWLKEAFYTLLSEMLRVGENRVDQIPDALSRYYPFEGLDFVLEYDPEESSEEEYQYYKAFEEATKEFFPEEIHEENDIYESLKEIPAKPYIPVRAKKPARLNTVLAWFSWYWT